MCSSDLDPFQAADPVMQRFNSHPPFRRAYWRGLKDAVDGPLTDDSMNAFLDPRYAVLRANGIPVTLPEDAKSFLRQQRTFLKNQLATVNAKFSVAFAAPYDSSREILSLKGAAPVEVASIAVNGITWPVTWTSATAWTSQVAYACSTNTLVVAGVDRLGRPIDGEIGRAHV